MGPEGLEAAPAGRLCRRPLHRSPANAAARAGGRGPGPSVLADDHPGRHGPAAPGPGHASVHRDSAEPAVSGGSCLRSGRNNVIPLDIGLGDCRMARAIARVRIGRGQVSPLVRQKSKGVGEATHQRGRSNVSARPPLLLQLLLQRAIQRRLEVDEARVGGDVLERQDCDAQ
jgi:hypothetical protein